MWFLETVAKAPRCHEVSAGGLLCLPPLKQPFDT